MNSQSYHLEKKKHFCLLRLSVSKQKELETKLASPLDK